MPRLSGHFRGRGKIFLNGEYRGECDADIEVFEDESGRVEGRGVLKNVDWDIMKDILNNQPDIEIHINGRKVKVLPTENSDDVFDGTLNVCTSGEPVPLNDDARAS